MISFNHGTDNKSKLIKENKDMTKAEQFKNEVLKLDRGEEIYLFIYRMLNIELILEEEDAHYEILEGEVTLFNAVDGNDMTFVYLETIGKCAMLETYDGYFYTGVKECTLYNE